MNEIIKIETQNDQHTVSGRDLHAALEVQTPYADWIRRMLEYGFEDEKDYGAILRHGKGFGKAVSQVDHHLTLDTAKEIAMLQRTEKGKQVRLYFIEAEKQLRQNSLASLDQSRRLDIARAEERTRFLESSRHTVTADDHFVRLPANTRLSEVSITKNGTMTIRFTPEK